MTVTKKRVTFIFVVVVVATMLQIRIFLNLQQTHEIREFVVFPFHSKREWKEGGGGLSGVGCLETRRQRK